MTPPDPNLPPLMVGSPVRGRPALIADLEHLSDEVTGEIIDGRLIVSPRPAPPLIEGASVLGGALIGPFRLGQGGPGGWIILAEPELRLGINALTDEPNVTVPDLAGWRRERLPERPKTAWYPVAPDWICEFLSPSTAAVDRVDKMPHYAREGVKWLWLVDVALQTLEAYELRDDRWVVLETHRADARVRVPPFETLELDLRLLWEH